MSDRNYLFVDANMEKRVSSSTDVGVILPLGGWYPHLGKRFKKTSRYFEASQVCTRFLVFLPPQGNQPPQREINPSINVSLRRGTYKHTQHLQCKYQGLTCSLLSKASARIFPAMSARSLPIVQSASIMLDRVI